MVTMCYKAQVYKNAHFLAPNPSFEILVVKLDKEECCSAPPAVLLCSEDEGSDETGPGRSHMPVGRNNPSVASCCSLTVCSAATNPVEHWICHSEQPKKQAQVSGARSRCGAPAAAPAHGGRLGSSPDQ